MGYQLGKDDAPFFILGCVRSGTTMLRDLLRLHPRLECPEETHFYRWADPYGSPRYDKNYITMRIFENHRKIDGISDNVFHTARHVAQDRKEMSEAYGRLYLSAVDNTSGRWFDKTPQNIYGIFLLANNFPESKFVHIYRHPLNVVASLVEGKVMARHSVKGAINYWLEAMILISEFKKLYPGRIYELSYEEITVKPLDELSRLCQFLNEDPEKIDLSKVDVHPEENKYLKVLSKDEIASVMARCKHFTSIYKYGEDPALRGSGDGR